MKVKGKVECKFSLLNLLWSVAAISAPNADSSQTQSLRWRTSQIAQKCPVCPSLYLFISPVFAILSCSLFDVISAEQTFCVDFHSHLSSIFLSSAYFSFFQFHITPRLSWDSSTISSFSGLAQVWKVWKLFFCIKRKWIFTIMLTLHFLRIHINFRS